MNAAVNTSAKAEANRLEYEAQKKLSELRTTPEITKAEEDRQNALIALIAKRQQLAEVGEGLGDDVNSPFASSDLAKAYRQVKVLQNEDGSADVMIYPDDAPEVSGVDWSKWEGEK